MSSFAASSVERGIVSSENNLFEIAAALWNVFYIVIIGIHVKVTTSLITPLLALRVFLPLS